MNIIEELKKNKQPLILMNSELQNAMLSMHPKEFICLQDTSALNDPQWKGANSDKWYVSENLYNVFRLRSDYEDEPEIVECEITDTADGYRIYSGGGDEDMGIHAAFRRKNHIGFKFEDGVVSGVPIRYLLTCGHFNTFAFKELAEVTFLHATHVLFRRQK